MNSITYNVLERLKEAGGEVDLYQVCEGLGISKRILSYNLEKLNYLFERESLPAIAIENGTLKLTGADEADYLRMRRMICDSYVLSRGERKALILYQCALINRFSNIDLLARWLDVSRSTLITEMTELKGDLAKPGVSLKSVKNGYKLVGDEVQIRYVLMTAYYDQIAAIPGEVRQRYIEEDLDVRNDITGILEQSVWESEKMTGGNYSSDAIREIVRYCNLIYLRNRQNGVAESGQGLETLPEYRAADFMIKGFRQNGIEIQERETGYLALVLLSTRLNEREAGKPEKEIQDILDDLVEAFEQVGLISFDRSKELYRMLAIHVRAMYYRVRYRIKIHNPFTYQIVENYYGIFSITRKVADQLEEKYGLRFSVEEVAYLSIYIGGFLKAENQDTDLKKKKILLLCGSGLGTSYLLKQQIIGLLGDSYRYVIKDLRSFKEEDLAEYAMVLSTVETGIRSANLMKVDSLMTTGQKERLLNWKLEEIRGDETNPMSRIINIIERYTTIQDTENLLRDLRQHVKQDDGILHLKDVIRRDYIRIADREMELEEGIWFSCEPLIREGVIRAHYISAIMSMIEQCGLYFEYVPGMLLAHANAPEDVNGLGISLAVFPHPLKYDGKEIRYIFTLATPDNKVHAAALDELFKIMVGERMKSIDPGRAGLQDYYQLLKCIK